MLKCYRNIKKTDDKIISLQKGVIHGTVSSTLKGVKVSCLYFLYIVTLFPFRGMEKMVAIFLRKKFFLFPCLMISIKEKYVFFMNNNLTIN